ncbi:hypothetical protein LIER_36072 [Lithospermum erythrorhizon]|uniref:Uncharacterized protein n=1 Tax=Lithospermum erythrorhizon TaxID=34254 RepID=A0AAV3P095_LITER
MKENHGDGSKPSQIQENASTTQPILPNKNQIESSNLVPNPPNQPTLDTQSNESSNGGLSQKQRETNNDEQKMNETLVEDSNNPAHANSNTSSLDLQLAIHNETESLNDDSN